MGNHRTKAVKFHQEFNPGMGAAPSARADNGSEHERTERNSTVRIRHGDRWNAWFRCLATGSGPFPRYEFLPRPVPPIDRELRLRASELSSKKHDCSGVRCSPIRRSRNPDAVARRTSFASLRLDSIRTRPRSYPDFNQIRARSPRSVPPAAIRSSRPSCPSSRRAASGRSRCRLEPARWQALRPPAPQMAHEPVLRHSRRQS